MLFRKSGQMSESILMGIILSLSGGFQDAYTYNCRNGVFANAQTGNMVLLGQNFAMGNWQTAFRYLIPVLAFSAGVYLSERIRYRFKNHINIHWRQVVILLEALLLFLVGWMPQSVNLAANIIVSFVCAMQVDSFRKIKGNTCSTTMCIGNLKTATELFHNYRTYKKPDFLSQSLLYYSFLLIFIIGAAAGGILTSLFKEYAIWICCILLMIGFAAMFIPEDIETGSCDR